jgi:hypothetical protein
MGSGMSGYSGYTGVTGATGMSGMSGTSQQCLLSIEEFDESVEVRLWLRWTAGACLQCSVYAYAGSPTF